MNTKNNKIDYDKNISENREIDKINKNECKSDKLSQKNSMIYENEGHFVNIIKNAMEKVKLVLTDKMIAQFDLYYNFLIEYNNKINLTSIVDKEEIYLKHFSDSILGAKFFCKNATVCDIGTGAGFPGVVLKIVRPDLNVVLVDGLEKRVKFLELLIKKLGLQGISALHFRAEDVLFKKNYLNTFDYVTARAVAKLNTLCEYCLPFVKIGGTFVAYKSDNIQEEIENTKNAVKILGGGNILCETRHLDDVTLRNFVIVKKISETTIKYPRAQNYPRLNPIK